MNQQEHWDKVYSTKGPAELSWYQQQPETSLSFFRDLNTSKDSAIIDIGGGDSKLVDFLLDKGYIDITVVDISEKALEKSKERLGVKAKQVNWVVADIKSFQSNKKFDVWHDRAVLHFLTNDADRQKYLEVANRHLNYQAKIIIGTFSDKGPEKCSGLPVKKYSESSLSDFLEKYFKKIKCTHFDHITPFKTVQNFLFCSFLKTI